MPIIERLILSLAILEERDILPSIIKYVIEEKHEGKVVATCAGTDIRFQHWAMCTDRTFVTALLEKCHAVLVFMRY